MKNKKILCFVGVIILVFIVKHFLGLSHMVEYGMEYLENIVTQNRLLAILIYIGLTILGCVVLALPGVTFAIAAGILFGPIVGTLCCSVATTIGAMAAFLIGRFFLKDSIEPMVKKNHYIKKWLFDESEKNDLIILMVTRLVPIFPYNLQNFAYGVTDISFGRYSLFSFLFMIPGTAMYTIGAAGVASGENRIMYIGIAIVFAVILMGVGRVLKKRYLTEEDKNGK